MTTFCFRLPRAASSPAVRCLLLLAAGAIAAPAVADTGCPRPVADAIPLLETMERSWAEVSDYTSTLLKTERFVDGTITEERGSVRFRKPDQVYLHVLEGANAGAELLYPKPGTDDVILARPGGVTGAMAGFLVNVPAIGNLVPYEFNLDDSRLTDGQHHPLPDSTIAGMMDLISVNLRAATRRQEGSVCFHAGERVDGHRTIKIEVLLPPEVGTWHTVAEGETLWTIGARYGQDRYVILYNNPSIGAEQKLSPGDRIFVPQYYAPRSLLWVSKSYNLPVKLQMYDVEKRLYEAYSNTDLQIDVGLGKEDFDPVLHGFPVVATSDEKPSKDIRTR
ncbi:MAG: DUF1571 domain-containing protein [Gammaproteobacteria bacterium]|nr:DUF1571 domain-containing protein [Gammaproteobacteria bacterium]